MRGVLHVVLHGYYVLLTLTFLYGDTITSKGSWPELATLLRGLPLAQVAIAVAIFMDTSRAPDCDISCKGTILGYVAYLLAKPFVRSHRGWYHSVWAAVYVAGLTSIVVALVVHTLSVFAGYFGIVFHLSTTSAAYTAFSASLLSYSLHLVEDSLTKKGVSWFGYRIKGPVSTGATDVHYAFLLIATSASSAVATYVLVNSVSISALVGLLVILLDFTLLIGLRS
ncbi:MAG: metal-dependent hydrolase [Sulfolobales archaeon]